MSRCLLLLTLSYFTGVEPTTVLRTPVRYVEGFVGAAQGVRIRVQAKNITPLRVVRRRSRTCDL